MSGSPRDISRSCFFGLCNRYCWLSLAKGVRSTTWGHVFRAHRWGHHNLLLPFQYTASETWNKQWEQRFRKLLFDSFWGFAGGNWAAGADDRGVCCCSGAQLQYGCVRNVSLLFSRCVKLPLAEEYSPPCPDRGTCNGSNGVVEGKALSKSVEAFQHFSFLTAFGLCVCTWLKL